MDQLETPCGDESGAGPATSGEALCSGLAGEALLFLHAGGLPVDAIASQLTALRCFGAPKPHFDLEGPMWQAMADSSAKNFACYFISLIDRTTHEAGRLSALIDYRDLLWLEQRPIFKEQLGQRLRVIRLAFLDPALQALRRTKAARPADAVLEENDDAPGFAAVARELIMIEEAEQLGDDFVKRHGLPMVKIWIEDLARPSVPALRGLLDRWSIRLPKGGAFLPIEPPSHSELAIVTAFREEAQRRHWSHALLPDR